MQGAWRREGEEEKVGSGDSAGELPLNWHDVLANFARSSRLRLPRRSPRLRSTLFVPPPTTTNVHNHLTVHTTVRVSSAMARGDVGVYVYSPAVSQLQVMHYWKQDPHLTFPRPLTSVPSDQVSRVFTGSTVQTVMEACRRIGPAPSNGFSEHAAHLCSYVFAD